MIPTPQELCVKYPANQMCILLALSPDKGYVVQAWKMNLCSQHAPEYVAENLAYGGQQISLFNLDPAYNWCQRCYALELRQERWPSAQVATAIAPRAF